MGGWNWRVNDGDDTARQASGARLTRAPGRRYREDAKGDGVPLQPPDSCKKPDG